MQETLFLKLGGSLITDKTRPYTARADKLAALASEIREALSSNPDLRLVLGHGSGSFGHFAVQQHMLQSLEQAGPETYWPGFAEVWFRAAQLNHLVMHALHASGLRVIAMPASSTLITRGGDIQHWDTAPLRSALEAGLIPVIYGDVVFDAEKGGCVVSTEDLMAHLAHEIHPQRILLAGLEAAVWADFPVRREGIEKLTPATYSSFAGRIGGSTAADVTGGMKSKVGQMLGLVQEIHGLSVVIFSGEPAGNLKKALEGGVLGTRIEGD